MRSMALPMSDVARRVSDRRRIDARSSEVVIGWARYAASSEVRLLSRAGATDSRRLESSCSRMIDR
jgi:hypothetical protein